MGIVIPAAWTATEIGFQAASSLGGVYSPVYRPADSGSRWQFAAGAGRYITIPTEDTTGVHFLKIERLDSEGETVAQEADRQISVIYR